MPLISQTASLAAGASANVMLNSIYETLPFNALLEFAAYGSAIGLTWAVSSGSDILAETGSALGVPAVANQFPKYPDDFHLNDVAGRGERVKVLISNPTAGAITFFASVRVTPL